jgi:hypothetical protein
MLGKEGRGRIVQCQNSVIYSQSITFTKDYSNLSHSEERNGEAPLGYLGRTALRREQCNVYDEALLGSDPASEV